MKIYIIIIFILCLACQGKKQDSGNTEAAVKPKVGTMLVFPNWLKHSVFPFFGEGERRSMAMNWNIYETEEELKSWMTVRESSKYGISQLNRENED